MFLMNDFNVGLEEGESRLVLRARFDAPRSGVGLPRERAALEEAGGRDVGLLPIAHRAREAHLLGRVAQRLFERQPPAIGGSRDGLGARLGRQQREFSSNQRVDVEQSLEWSRVTSCDDDADATESFFLLVHFFVVHFGQQSSHIQNRPCCFRS